MLTVPVVGALLGEDLPFPFSVTGDVVMAKRTNDINDQLADLHMGLALLLKKKLQNGSITSSELSVLRQFLKDNNISAQPAEGTPFGDLVSALPDLDKVVHMPRRRTA